MKANAEIITLENQLKTALKRNFEVYVFICASQLT